MDPSDSETTPAVSRAGSPIAEILSFSNKGSPIIENVSSRRDHVSDAPSTTDERAAPIPATPESARLTAKKTKVSRSQRIAIALGLKARPKPSQPQSRQSPNGEKTVGRKKKANNQSRNNLTTETAAHVSGPVQGVGGDPSLQKKPNGALQQSSSNSIAAGASHNVEASDVSSTVEPVPADEENAMVAAQEPTKSDPKAPSITQSSFSTPLVAPTTPPSAATKRSLKKSTSAAIVAESVKEDGEDESVGISNRWKKQSEALSHVPMGSPSCHNQNRSRVEQPLVVDTKQSVVTPTKSKAPAKGFGFFGRGLGRSRKSDVADQETTGADNGDDDDASGRFSAPYSPSVMGVVRGGKKEPVIATNMAQSTSYFILPTPVGGSPWFNLLVSGAIFWPLCHFFTEEVFERKVPQSWPSEDDSYRNHEYSGLFLQKAETARDELWRMVFVLAGLFVLYARWTCFDMGFFLSKRRKLLRQYLQMGTEATVALLRREDESSCCGTSSCFCCGACSMGGGNCCTTVLRTIRSRVCFLCGLRPEEKGIVTYKYESFPFGALLSVDSVHDESTVRPSTQNMTDSQRQRYFGVSPPEKKEATERSKTEDVYEVETSMMSNSTESSVGPSTKDMTDSQRRMYFGLVQGSTQKDPQGLLTPARKVVSLDRDDNQDDETSGGSSSVRPTTKGMTDSERMSYFGVSYEEKKDQNDRTESDKVQDEENDARLQTTSLSPKSPVSFAQTPQISDDPFFREKSFVKLRGSDWFVARRSLGTLVPVPPKGEEMAVRVMLLSPNDPLSGRIRDDLEVEWAVTSSDRVGFQVNLFLGISWMVVTGVGIGYTIYRIVSFVPTDQLIIPCMILGMMFGPLMVILFTIQLALWMYHKERFVNGGDVVATSSDRRGRPRMIHTPNGTPSRPAMQFDTRGGPNSPWAASTDDASAFTGEESVSETGGSVTSPGYSAPETPGNHGGASSSLFFSQTKSKGREVASKALRALHHRHQRNKADDPLQSSGDSKTRRLLDDVVASELYEYYQHPSTTDEDDDDDDLEFGHSANRLTDTDMQKIFEDPQDDDILQCMPSAFFRECEGGTYGHDGNSTVVSTPVRSAVFANPFASPTRIPFEGRGYRSPETHYIPSPPPAARTSYKQNTSKAAMTTRTSAQDSNTTDPIVARRSPVNVSLADARDSSDPTESVTNGQDAPSTTEVVNAYDAPSKGDGDDQHQPTTATYGPADVDDTTVPENDSTREITNEGTRSSCPPLPEV